MNKLRDREVKVSKEKSYDGRDNVITVLSSGGTIILRLSDKELEDLSKEVQKYLEDGI